MKWERVKIMLQEAFSRRSLWVRSSYTNNKNQGVHKRECKQKKLVWVVSSSSKYFSSTCMIIIPFFSFQWAFNKESVISLILSLTLFNILGKFVKPSSKRLFKATKFLDLTYLINVSLIFQSKWDFHVCFLLKFPNKKIILNIKLI